MRFVRCVAAVLALTIFLGAGPLGAVQAWAQSRALAPGGLFDDAPSAAPPATLAGATDGGLLAVGGLDRPRDPAAPGRSHAPLSAERAQLLLRSLTLPGWGQATLERNHSAAAFGLAELGLWTAFTAFRVQVQMRRDSYERSARLLAGIDLDGRDEEFRRIVGAFISSDEYNLLVVYRDAANLYYDDPVAYRQYIAEHELKGKDTWNWNSEESLLRYRAQRRNVTQASQRANTVLAAAIVNRLLSALHVARAAREPKAGAEPPRSWKLELSPSDPNDATAYRLGIRTRF